MNKLSFLYAALFFTTSVFAQKKDDINNIRKLCGCFDVEFKYAETFAPDEEYQYHNRERITQAIEWVTPVEERKNKFVIQHLLVVGDSMVIKHWREDWEFEKQELLLYTGNNTWEKKKLDKKQVKNNWTQTVWEVSDAPRYQGVSNWVETDDKIFWMNTTDAPLPRREYTKRKDYNILKRRNTIIVGEPGWTHEQDNEKIMRQNGKDSLITEEKGINSYRRIDDTRCAAAKKYWDKNKEYWGGVRLAWDKYILAHDTIGVRSVLNGRPLFEALFEIEQQYADGQILKDDISAKIESTLNDYLTDKSMAGE